MGWLATKKSEVDIAWTCERAYCGKIFVLLDSIHEREAVSMQGDKMIGQLMAPNLVISHF